MNIFSRECTLKKRIFLENYMDKKAEIYSERISKIKMY